MNVKGRLLRQEKKEEGDGGMNSIRVLHTFYENRIIKPIKIDFTKGGMRRGDKKE
jgi:hypothetical protein